MCTEPSDRTRVRRQDVRALRGDTLLADDHLVRCARGLAQHAVLTAGLWQESASCLRRSMRPMTQASRDRMAALPIRPVQPTDRAEWLRMRRNLWGGAAEEHAQDIDTYFASPQAGVTLVVARSAGGLCGFIEVSLRTYAEGCTTSPVAYIEG